MNSKNNTFFEINTKLNKKIRTTIKYWKKIINKHPPIKDLVNETKETLSFPDEIKISKKDESVFLYYRNYKNFILCVVVRHFNDAGYIITVYPTRNIKFGRTVWKK